MNKIILIGGPPTVGKSYTARKIAGLFGIPWISTDTVREQMRKIVKEEDFPNLFLHSDATSEMAADFLSSKSAKEIVMHQNTESIDVWEGVSALIKTDYVWGDFIVEGVAVLPNLVKELSVENKKMIPIFLIDNNVERIRKTIFTRGLWDDAEKYPDSVKEKEVEWVLEFNNYIIRESKKYDFPVVEIADQKRYISKIEKLIK
jgi:2-phosphoglycerate kinase